MRPVPDVPTGGQESVWAYPRPPRAELTARYIRIEHRGVTVADTRRAVRTLETSHPPTYYIFYRWAPAELPIHPRYRYRPEVRLAFVA